MHPLLVSKISLKSSEIYTLYYLIILIQLLLNIKLHPHQQSKYYCLTTSLFTLLPFYQSCNTISYSIWYTCTPNYLLHICNISFRYYTKIFTQRGAHTSRSLSQLNSSTRRYYIVYERYQYTCKKMFKLCAGRLLSVLSSTDVSMLRQCARGDIVLGLYERVFVQIFPRIF